MELSSPSWKGVDIEARSTQGIDSNIIALWYELNNLKANEEDKRRATVQTIIYP
jgi:hypothetical protein